MDVQVEKNPGLEWLEKSRAYRETSVVGAGGDGTGDILLRPDSWLDLDQLDTGGVYHPTIKFSGDYIDARHEAFTRARYGLLDLDFCIDLGIEGYLQLGDVLKLYELARLTTGNVLELGTHYGLSTSVIAGALAERGSGRIETVDTHAPTTAVAAQNIRGLPGEELVTFTVQDGAARMAELAAEGKRFSFIFIDHWHGYQATFDAAKQLHTLLEPGGFVQFHDFADKANADPDHFYGVFQAVLDTVCEDPRFVFCCISGCTAVFQFLRPSSN